MGKKHTTEQFIEKARKVHGDKYDYSKVQYVNYLTKVTIICPIHGEFQQVPNNHVNIRCGCPKCSYDVKRQQFSQSLDDFIRKADKVHNNKYQYHLVNYVNSHTKVQIVCPEHGVFEQTPTNHIEGYGCKHCSRQNRLKKSRQQAEITFKQKASQVHSNKYDYSCVQYVNTHTKVDIICPHHGVFRQTPSSHLQGYGCPQCKGERQTKRQTKSVKLFIEQANQIHNNKYRYDVIDYVNSHTKVDIICPHHGVFRQTPSSHLQGYGCPQCKKMMVGVYSNIYFENNPDKKNIEAYVYVIKYKQYIKIGITRRTVNQRFPNIDVVQILYEHKTTLYQAYLIEQQILTTFKKYKIQTIDEKFNGWTECFENINPDNLIEQIKIWERGTRQSNS